MIQLEPLTLREEELLALMVQDKPYAVIARELNLHEGTVRNHASNILAKLDVTGRRDTVLYACQQGLYVKAQSESGD